MKNILLSIIMLSFLLFSACEEINKDILVGGDGSADLSGRAYANIDPPTQVKFLFQGTTEISVDLGKVENAGTTITSVVITKILYIADLDDDPDTKDPIQSAPVEYTLTSDNFTQNLTELFADVPIDGNVLIEDDLDPGDSWSLSYIINISGSAPTGSNILLVPVKTSIPFACPSAIPTEGTWTGVTQEGAFGEYSTNVSVTLTDLGDGNYSISDGTGGFYTAFGFPENQPLQFVDICNGLTITGNVGANFSIGTNAGEGFPAGTWDSVTETITLPWYDSGNGFGDVTVLTRN